REDGGQHAGGRRLGGRDVQLPPLLGGAGAGRGGEGPRPLDREPPLGTGRRQEGAGGDGEIAEDRQVEGSDIHGQRALPDGDAWGEPGELPSRSPARGPSGVKHRDRLRPSTALSPIPARIAPNLMPAAS